MNIASQGSWDPDTGLTVVPSGPQWSPVVTMVTSVMDRGYKQVVSRTGVKAGLGPRPSLCSGSLAGKLVQLRF